MAIAFLIARILFGGFFVVNGLMHFLNFQALSGAAAQAGIPLPGAAVAVSGLMIIAGGLSILLGFLPNVGAGLIVVFLAIAALTVHTFWAIDDPQMKFMQQVFFMRNLALIGAALAFSSVPRPWRWSLESGAGVRVKRPAHV